MSKRGVLARRSYCRWCPRQQVAARAFSRSGAWPRTRPERRSAWRPCLGCAADVPRPGLGKASQHVPERPHAGMVQAWKAIHQNDGVAKWRADPEKSLEQLAVLL